jgi:hypothetical protein
MLKSLMSNDMMPGDPAGFRSILIFVIFSGAHIPGPVDRLNYSLKWIETRHTVNTFRIGGETESLISSSVESGRCLCGPRIGGPYGKVRLGWNCQKGKVTPEYWKIQRRVHVRELLVKG